MADVEFDETLEFVDPDNVLDFYQDVTAETKSTPYWLNHLSGDSLFVAAVHTLLVDSGFVRLDSETGGAPVYGLQIPSDHLVFASKMLSFRYTLSQLIYSKNVSAEFVTVKFHKLHRTLVIHCSLSGNTNNIYTVKLHESLYASMMELLRWKSILAGSEVYEDVLMDLLSEKDAFDFSKELMDKLVLPLLTDICYKAGLPIPPCFMLLPTELKLKIFELVGVIDLINLARVCSELLYLTSDNLLWKANYVRVFRNGGGSETTNWKQKFVSSWIISDK